MARGNCNCLSDNRDPSLSPLRIAQEACIYNAASHRLGSFVGHYGVRFRAFIWRLVDYRRTLAQLQLHYYLDRPILLVVRMQDCDSHWY